MQIHFIEIYISVECLLLMMPHFSMGEWYGYAWLMSIKEEYHLNWNVVYLLLYMQLNFCNLNYQGISSQDLSLSYGMCIPDLV